MKQVATHEINVYFEAQIEKMPQFKAGYVVDAVAKVIAEKRREWNINDTAHRDDSLKLDGLLANACSFDVHFSNAGAAPDFANLPPVLATLNNIITRGLPTRVPVAIEEAFVQAGITKQKVGSSIQYESTKNHLDYKTLFELLHFIEPGLTINKEQYAGNPESELEWQFVNQHEFLKQILQTQRDFATISPEMAGGRRIDFCFSIPYFFRNEKENRDEVKGYIFEVDGPHHQWTAYQHYDKYRDNAAAENGYDTIRFTVGTINPVNPNLNALLQNDYFRIFQNNYSRSITPELVTYYSLIFIPIAVARIQKTLVEYFLRHPEIFHRETIRVAIIERDFPCGAMAIECLQEMFLNINNLIVTEQQLPLPRIELTICRDSEAWRISPEISLGLLDISEDEFDATEYDIIIDHSILRRAGIYSESTFTGKENTIIIRSAHYADNTVGTARRTYCADLLAYKPLVTKNPDGSFPPVATQENAVTYFLQNIFRKPKFREGQLPIIDRALRQLPVIGLLPTGGGKSIAYQLPALLQPGLCIVVDPIKSLMEDQVRVLKENNLIDCCDYINSNLHLQPGEMQKRLTRFSDGEYHFLFVSPERFVIEDFRKKIKNMGSFIHGFALSFAYCVIDEVHCVSEWGHDFRTTYLMLGKNAQEYMHVRLPRERVSLVGLTATASFDVLADIERELQIDHTAVSDAIVMIENTIRPELFFRIIDVTGRNRCSALDSDFSCIGANVSKINNREILEQSERHHFEEFEKADFLSVDGLDFAYNDRYLIHDSHLSDAGPDKFSAIVFCPVKGTRRNNNGDFINENGVCYVYQNLSSSHEKGFYFGSSQMDEDGTEADDGTFSSQVQQHFRDFLAGHTKHMICTKAFGMGIDKEDVRTTYHYYYSGSLESLVQECGRAGRDKKIAEANILLSTATYYIVDVHRLFSENKKDFEPLRFGGANNRIAIRKNLSKKWNDETGRFDEVRFPTLENALQEINQCPLSLTNREGTVYYQPTAEELTQIREKLQEKNEDGTCRYIISKKEDRSIHEFFYSITFKGIETEKAQLRALLYESELEGVFADTLNECRTDTFSFTLLGTKRTKNSSTIVCGLIAVNPTHINPRRGINNAEVISNCFTYAVDFDDFMSLLGESGYGNLPQNEKALHTLYHKDRKLVNDTGRLIYRMSCMGLLTSYEIAYNHDKLHKCTFRKHNDIEAYLTHIEQYFRRYLSEKAALEKTAALRTRLKQNDLVADILECLIFLTEFSYGEIAEKRKRAIDQIEEVMHNAAKKENWFEQNKYIKEEIYFYFNAKYARPGYSFNNLPFSLFDDYYTAYRGNRKGASTQSEILKKYLLVYKDDEGTHQNQYKHMIGSCKKIQRTLLPDELKKEWVLRLLKAFAMFAVNNPSYIAEACTEVETGFLNLYRDEEYKRDTTSITKIFDEYFKELLQHVTPENHSNNIIRTIRLKLLLELQYLEIEAITAGKASHYL